MPAEPRPAATDPGGLIRSACYPGALACSSRAISAVKGNSASAELFEPAVNVARPNRWRGGRLGPLGVFFPDCGGFEGHLRCRIRLRRPRLVRRLSRHNNLTLRLSSEPHRSVMLDMSKDHTFMRLGLSG